MSAVFRAARVDFDRLYRRHVATVYRYVYAVLGNHADAEDVTQQTFLNAYRAVTDGTKPRKTENWLLTIAHNEIRRHFRRTYAKPLEIALDESVADATAERSEPSLGEVVRALQHIPPIQRSALVMREFEGRSYAEIAEILDVTQSALETLIFRARRALADELEGALTCAEAEQALSRRLDGRLRRREARRLKAHLHDCPLCVRYAQVQKRQRSLLRGFSVMPIPASLFLFRGEQAAAATLSASAAATGGSTAAAGGGIAGFAGAFAFKAAAVTATVGVAGGVGYTVTKPDPAPRSAKAAVAQAVVAGEERANRPIAAVALTKRHGDHSRSARPQKARPQRRAVKAKPPAAHARSSTSIASAKKVKQAHPHASAKTPPVARAAKPPAAKKPKHTARHSPRARSPVAKEAARPQPARGKRAHPVHVADKPKPPREAGPAPVPTPPGRGPKH